MKKLVAFLLGSAMVAASVAGLAACGRGGGGGGSKNVVRRPDPRAADAYEAYDYLGNKIGAYKTIGLAINATVEADLDFTEDVDVDQGEMGGYVIKKGSTRHLFENYKGFGEGNSDCFWYYENGNELAAYNCWDETLGIANLQNTKAITHQTGDFGTLPMQSWNGFALLDAYGQPIPNSTKSVPVWELSKPMDAGIMGYSARLKGTSGLRYSLDFTNTKITPAYDGVEEKVYAFFGTYIWDGYYVIATGLGCDTTTGEWYPFRGTSRNDSFVDIKYNVDNAKKPVFTSTWHNEGDGGYFTPDVKTADFEIKTCYGGFDEIEEESWWEDRLTIVFDRGTKSEKTYSTVIDDAVINDAFGLPVNPTNGYVFIAGLDIKNHDEDADTAPNVDYFNGAKFENFTMTDAAIYVPTEDEISDMDYPGIDPAARGQWHDALMANDEVTPELWDYTYLYNYSCTSYEKKDGTDVYAFRFDGDPVSEHELAPEVRSYQDKIDKLAEMTIDNVGDYMSIYDEVAKWYGKDPVTHEGFSGIVQQHLLLLNFEPFVKAQKVYESSIKLSDEALAILEEIEKYPYLSTYTYKGWTAPEGATDHDGYLWTQAQDFGKTLEKYNALTDPMDKGNILRRYKGGEEEFNNWKSAYEDIKAYLENPAYAGKTITTGKVDMTATETLTPEQALQHIMDPSFEILSYKWDPSPITQENKGAFNSDSTGNFYRTFHILFLLKKMEENGMKVPAFYENTIFSRLTHTARAEAFVSDFNNYIYPVLTLSAKIYATRENGDFVWLNEELADEINACMVGFEAFDEAGFNWNCVQHTQNDLRDGETNYEVYFGLPGQNNSFRKNLQNIIEVVSAGDPTAKLNDNGLAYKAAVKPLAVDPREQLSAKARATYEAYKDFSRMPEYHFLGWKAPGEDIKGYLYDEVLKFKTDVLPKYNDLSEEEKAEFTAVINVKSFNEWLELAKDTTIQETYQALGSIPAMELYANPKVEDKQSFTGMQLFEHLVRWAYKLKVGGSFGDYNDYRTGNGILDFNGAPFPSSYFCYLYDTLLEKAGAGYELPNFLKELLEDIKFKTFYETAYNPITKTALLAKNIKDNSLTKITELSAAELSFLNEVWTDTYEIGDLLTWNWNKGGKFEQYLSEAMIYMIELAGGTLQKQDETVYKCYEYFDVVAAFLKNIGYTIHDNGWGVTDGTITAPVEEDPIGTAEEINAAFAKLSDATDMSKYDYKGWTTINADKKGYLYSEVTLFGRIQTAYNALSDKSGVTVYDNANWKAWKKVSDEFAAITAEKLALTIAAADREETRAVTYTVADVLGELIVVADKAKASEKGKLDFDYGVAGHTTFRAFYFLYELERLEVPVPTFITERIEEVDDGSLEEDMRYVATIMRIAKALKANPGYVLTAEEVKMVNDNLVGKDVFNNSGFAWGYTGSTSGGAGNFEGDITAWHGKGYQVYFGLSGDFVEFQKTVISYLVEKYGATNLKYNSEAAPEDNMMGIVSAISDPVK